MVASPLCVDKVVVGGWLGGSSGLTVDLDALRAHLVVPTGYFVL